jgi:hypothetical protein
MKLTIRSISLAAILSTVAVMQGSPVFAFDSAPLHTIDSQTYNLTFEGTVKNAPTGTEVQAKISQNGTWMTVSGPTDADGRFSLKMSVDAYANEPMDWILSAQTSQLTVRIDEGRKILSREEAIAISRTHELSTDDTQTASLY